MHPKKNLAQTLRNKQQKAFKSQPNNQQNQQNQPLRTFSFDVSMEAPFGSPSPTALASPRGCTTSDSREVGASLEGRFGWGEGGRLQNKVFWAWLGFGGFVNLVCFWYVFLRCIWMYLTYLLVCIVYMIRFVFVECIWHVLKCFVCMFRYLLGVKWLPSFRLSRIKAVRTWVYKF